MTGKVESEFCSVVPAFEGEIAAMREYGNAAMQQCGNAGMREYGNTGIREYANA